MGNSCKNKKNGQFYLEFLSDLFFLRLNSYTYYQKIIKKNFVVVSELRKCLRFEAMHLSTEVNINTKIAGGSNSSKQMP